MCTVTWEKCKLHHRMENKVKTSSNQIRPGKFEEKYRFNERIEYLTLLYISSSLATVISMSVLQIDVHGVNFFESRGVEEEHNLFVSNFINKVGFIEISQEVYWNVRKGSSNGMCSQPGTTGNLPAFKREGEEKQKLLPVLRNQIYQHS